MHPWNPSSRILAGILGFLGLLWLAGRVIPAMPVVFPETGGPVLLGNDPWFHLHQTRGSVANFPKLLRWDIAANFPKGRRSDAAGAFNQIAAALAILTGGREPGREHLIRVLAWTPVVFGLLSLAFAYGIGRELGGPRLGVLAVACRVLFPGGELERTLLGFGDYHALEILLASVSVWSFLKFSKSENVRDPRFPAALLASIPAALFFFTWLGAPVHLLLFLAAFWIAFTFTPGKGDAAKTAAKSLAYFAALFLWIGIIGWIHPQAILAPGLFRITLTGLFVHVLLLFLVLRWLCRSPRSGEALRWILPVVLILVFAITLFVSPSLRDHLRSLFEPRSPFIAEHESVGWQSWWVNFGPLLPWLGFGLVAMGQGSLPSSSRLALLYGLGWALLWQISSDFGYQAAAWIPLLAAFGLESAIRRFDTWKPAPWALPTATLGLTAFLFVIASIRVPWMKEEEVRRLLVATPAWTESMDWLRENTPPPALPTTYLAAPWDPKNGFEFPTGSYGIFSHWQHGNLICALAVRHAVSASSYSPVFARWMLTRTEAASLRHLDKNGPVSYLVLDAKSICDSFLGEAVQAGVSVDDIQVEEGEADLHGVRVPMISFGEPFRESTGARLYLGDGSGFEHYRLVHESAQESFIRYRMIPELEAVTLLSTSIETPEQKAEWLPLTKSGQTWTEDGGSYFCYSGGFVPTVKVFARVSGCRLEGTASPGAKVRITLPLRSETSGRTFVHRSEATADPSGKVHLLIPYSTERDAPRTSVHATGSCRIESGGKTIDLEISELDVATGALRTFAF